MKKKRPRITLSCPNLLFFCCLVLSAMPRRRHRVRCPIPPLSLTAAFSAASLLLLLFISLLSFFTPPFTDRHLRPQQLRSLSEDFRDESDAKIVFQVPRDGGSSKHDLWSSRLAKNFYGCSNASKKFEAEVNTLQDRYLAIATSGGLNQQRTGQFRRNL